MLGAVHILMAAGSVVPVVALHTVFIDGDDAARNAVARTLLVGGEAVGVVVNVLVMSGLNACAFGIFDAFIRA